MVVLKLNAFSSWLRGFENVFVQTTKSSKSWIDPIRVEFKRKNQVGSFDRKFSETFSEIRVNCYKSD